MTDERVRIGTVDRFQGQQAAVVFYSMASSSGEEVPRGLDFLFSRNRLNVAISRAQVLAIVVGHPSLSITSCGNLEQMKLVNAYCRAVEHGTTPAVACRSRGAGWSLIGAQEPAGAVSA